MRERPEFEDSDTRFARALLRHGMRNAAGYGDKSFKGLTQTELANQIQVSRPTVSAQVQRAGVLLSSGSPGLLLDPETCGYVIGIDFGEAHDRVVLADVHGQIYPPEEVSEGEFERPRDEEAAPVHFRWATERVEALLERAELHRTRIWAVGVSLPGPVNKHTERLQTVPKHMHQSWSVLRVELAEHLDLPRPHVESDYNASALTEHLWGSLRDRRHALYVKAGQRCACSLLINHRIYRGAEGIAGRLGKTYVPAPDPSSDGQWIDVESRFSLRGLAEAGHSGDAAELAERVTGDEELKELLHEGAVGLGIAIAPLIDAFNPESVVIGGALGRAVFAWVAGDLMNGIGWFGTGPARAAISDRLGPSTFSRGTSIRGAIASALLASGPARIAEAMES